MARDHARMADAGDAAARTATGARELPVVYRWAYDYSVPGAARDFIPQNEPPDASARRRGRTHDLVILLFMVGSAAFAGWWLPRQGLRASRGWRPAFAETVPQTGRSSLPTAKIGLGVFLAVAGSLFALLVSAYSMRMAMARLAAAAGCPGCSGSTRACWSLSSVALHWRAGGARARRETRGHPARLAGRRPFRPGLPRRPAPGLAAACWRRATASPPIRPTLLLPDHRDARPARAGRPRRAGPGRAQAAARRGDGTRSRLSVELCATYWHFLLVVWLVLFACSLHSPASAWRFAICSGSFG